MVIGWIKRWTMPLLAILALSACQMPGNQRGPVPEVQAAMPSCVDDRGYARSPASCYQRPLRRASQPSCDPSYRPARSSYRYAGASIPCAAVPPRQRGYRYVGEQAVTASGCEPAYRQSYRRSRPVYNDYRRARSRPARQYYRGSRRASCCY